MNLVMNLWVLGNISFLSASIYFPLSTKPNQKKKPWRQNLEEKNLEKNFGEKTLKKKPWGKNPREKTLGKKPWRKTLEKKPWRKNLGARTKCEQPRPWKWGHAENPRGKKLKTIKEYFEDKLQQCTAVDLFWRNLSPILKPNDREAVFASNVCVSEHGGDGGWVGVWVTQMSIC